MTKHMSAVEGGGAGACREIFSGGEEGESRNRRINQASLRSPKQGTLCRQEDGAYHIRRPRRIPFIFVETFPCLVRSSLKRRVQRLV